MIQMFVILNLMNVNDPLLASPKTPPTQSSSSFVGMMVLTLVGFGACFVGGIVVARLGFLSSILPASPAVVQVAQPSPQTTTQVANEQKPENSVVGSLLTQEEPRNTSEKEVVSETQQTPEGMRYFDDSILVLTEETPSRAFLITATRKQTNSGFQQSTRVSFFDGQTWVRKQTGQTYADNGIHTNNFIRSWNLGYHPSRVLRQSVRGEFMVNNQRILVDLPNLANEMTVRSLPGYTKFLSEGPATVEINGQKVAAKGLYTRIYSMNANDIQFYDTPFGLRTDWVAFWDEQGNFYHADRTNVAVPTSKYQTHQLALLKTAQGSVTTGFEVGVTDGAGSPPSDFTFELKDKLGAILRLRRVNQVNKAPNGSYVWLMGVVEGEVVSQAGAVIKGRGVSEYIQN